MAMAKHLLHIQTINEEQKKFLPCQLSIIIFKLEICLNKQDILTRILEITKAHINYQPTICDELRRPQP